MKFRFTDSVQDLFDPQFSEINVPRPEGYWNFFYNVYRHELCQAILGLCLEIKKLITTAQGADRGLMASDQEMANATFRFPSYTKGSLIHAVKDSLEPMKRRLAQTGPNFKDLVYFTIVLTSILPEQGGQTRVIMIEQALRELVQDCRIRLERNGVMVPVAPIIDDTTGNRESTAADGPAVGARFDPSWADFPDLDLFESFGSFTNHPR